MTGVQTCALPIYFRLNLLARDAAGNPVASYGTGDDPSDSYRHPMDDYEKVVPTAPGTPLFTVSKIEYDIRINQHQYATGDNRYISGAGNWTESDTAGAELNVPDYGTWFGVTNDNREDIVNNMALEVNGRMYTETSAGGINMFVDTAMEVGGTNSGNDRPGHVAMVRCDKPTNDHVKSGWSFQDYHSNGNYYTHTHDEAYMRHIRKIGRAHV